MGAVRGTLVGSLGLVTLYNLTSSSQAGLSTAAGLPAKLAHYIISPTVPLVPDLRPSNTPTPDGAGGANQTNPQGDRVYTNPNGQQYIGGPNGIPVLPLASTTPTPNSLTPALSALSGVQSA